jgi:hypothetical protein
MECSTVGNTVINVKLQQSRPKAGRRWWIGSYLCFPLGPLRAVSKPILVHISVVLSVFSRSMFEKQISDFIADKQFREVQYSIPICICKVCVRPVVQQCTSSRCFGLDVASAKRQFLISS